MARVLMVLGTRPEIIKLAPVYMALARNPRAQVETFWSGQHIELAEGLAELFSIRIDHCGTDLSACGSLGGKFGQIVRDIATRIGERGYDYVIVQGDTATATAGALAGFLADVPVVHIEAGLRTGDLRSPWPEEANRRVVSLCTSIHFAPTEQARRNLQAEGFADESIIVTGNTVIDALQHVRGLVANGYTPHASAIRDLPTDKKLILVTGHRRENFGKPLRNIVRALQELASDGDKCVVFPVHLNPDVRRTVYGFLNKTRNVHLLDPLRYPDFVYLMERAWTIITDSGGIQEEAPCFHRPIVITRESTERPEVVSAGFGRLVGGDPHRLVATVRELTRGSEPIFIEGANPFGTGDAAATITARLLAPRYARQIPAPAIRRRRAPSFHRYGPFSVPLQNLR